MRLEIKNIAMELKMILTILFVTSVLIEIKGESSNSTNNLRFHLNDDSDDVIDDSKPADTEISAGSDYKGPPLTIEFLKDPAFIKKVIVIQQNLTLSDIECVQKNGNYWYRDSAGVCTSCTRFCVKPTAGVVRLCQEKCRDFMVKNEMMIRLAESDRKLNLTLNELRCTESNAKFWSAENGGMCKDCTEECHNSGSETIGRCWRNCHNFMVQTEMTTQLARSNRKLNLTLDELRCTEIYGRFWVAENGGECKDCKEECPDPSSEILSTCRRDCHSYIEAMKRNLQQSDRIEELQREAETYLVLEVISVVLLVIFAIAVICIIKKSQPQLEIRYKQGIGRPEGDDDRDSAPTAKPGNFLL